MASRKTKATKASAEARAALEEIESALKANEGTEEEQAAFRSQREQLLELIEEFESEQDDAPEPWRLEKGGACTFCYTGPGAKKRRTKAKVLKVHKAEKGQPVLIDLECHVPERPDAANPVKFEKIAPHVEPTFGHIGTPPGYCEA